MTAEWAGVESEIGQAVDRYSAETLAAYREAPRFVEEHANIERAAVEGGYGRRQLFELIQNGADELIGTAGRVHVVLTDDALYCANEGRALTADGVGALLSSNLSAKRGTEIGRFGLGFKSVLAITTHPEIFSRSGSLTFDPLVAAARIREIVSDAPRTPILRIASAIEVADAAETDYTLAELMQWATTVVRLVRDTQDSSWLPQDLKDFPSEFLLFSPHVSELVLENREQGTKRRIASRIDGDELVLEGDGEESRWRVFNVEHAPGDAARLDAGAMADRERIPLVWAVPTRRGRRGEFWAFFPTLDQTTLSGVVNAPWKLNEDRTRIIDGPFNKELIERVALLVLENLSVLCSPDDPGILLELMPARGREAAGWADGELTATINDLAKISQTAPNQSGALMFPSTINLHPEGIARPTLALWSAQKTRPEDWAHPSVETVQRRARLEMYMGSRIAASVEEWLEALIPKEDLVAGSVAAITVASSLARMDSALLGLVQRARIVLDEAGELATVADGIFRRAPLPVEVDVRYVHPEVEAATAELLLNVGLRAVDSERILAVKLREERHKWGADDWDTFWVLIRQSAAPQAMELLQQAHVHPLSVRVRTRTSEYRPLGALLLPGEIVHEASVEDARCLIDTHFHADELRVLRFMGATGGPSRNTGSRHEPWFIEYRRLAEADYLERLKESGSAPNRDLLDFRDRPFAGPLTPLMTLSDNSRARYTTALLRAADDLEAWTFAHKTQTRYPEHPWPHPVVYMVKRKGILETTLGPRTVEEAVGPSLDRFGNVLPVADVPSHVAEVLGIPDRLEDLAEAHWFRALDRLLEADDDATIGAAYAQAARAGIPAPATIRCRIASGHDVRPAETVTVASDSDLVAVLSQTGEPYVRVDSDADGTLLVEAWLLRDADTAVRSEVVSVPSGEAEALGDIFPLLRPRLSPAQRELVLQPCSDIRVNRFTDSGRVGESRELVLEPEVVYFRGDLEQKRLLQLLDGKLALGLTEADIDAILRNVQARKVKALRTAIRKAADDPTRLLLAIDAEELRARIPKVTLDSVEAIEGSLDNVAIGELSLVIHGTRVLREHSDLLEERGLQPPQRWGGSRAAVRFVRELGFGIEFAGFESRKVDRFLEVEGPPEIGPLHDYQEIVVAEIRALLRSENGGSRGLLSLPTGAGKTRVTIEALVDAINDSELQSPVLWVAQTEELCEQAVQTWSELWRAKGPRERLTISRLRGDFEADDVEHGHQVVVATTSKLDAGVFEKASYDWLSTASCIIVDEAHTSVGQSYTRLLAWQGMERNKERAPLIGLTATPFRGNEAEMKTLVARYGRRRLDTKALGGEDAYPHLQRIGILAQVDHELLPGSDIRLSAEELKRLETFQRLPEAARQRLAADVGRNRTLLESIAALDDDWPVLLFGVSVEHAHTMAALLARAGIPAAAISADTDRGVRRHYIDQFRKGLIRVLANYDVLAAGFDAPRVRAVYIARPTYAPNRYQQMIGRGLRGPRNGGTERCLLVNVEDNVAQYGERLAFHEFEYLWEPEASTT